MKNYFCCAPYNLPALNVEFFIVRKIAFSNRRNFSSFIITIAIAAVALSLITMIVASSMINGFQKEIRNKVMGFRSHLQVVPYSLSQSLQETGIYKKQDFYTNPETLPYVAHIQASAYKGGLLKTDSEFDGIVLRGVGDDFLWSSVTPYLKKGRIVTPKEGRQDILVSKITAQRLQLDTGDKVTVTFMGAQIKSRPYRVCGIYETGMEEFDRKFAMVDIANIQQLNGWGPDTVGGFEIYLDQTNLFKSRARAYFITLFGGLLEEDVLYELRKDPLDDIADAVAVQINNPRLDVQTIKSLYPGIFDWLELQTMNEMIILTLMIIVAAINMITALLILILERTNMIGILKAMGSANASIRKLFMYYSLVIIGTGLLIGNTVGLGICLVQKHFNVIALPQESYYLTHAPIEIQWAWIIGLNIGTILTTLLMLLLPSMIIARISPVKAIRFD